MFGVGEMVEAGDFELTFNDKPVPRDQGRVRFLGDRLFAYLSHVDLCSAALQGTYTDVLGVFDHVVLTNHWWDSGFEGVFLHPYAIARNERNAIEFGFELAMNIDHWKHPWTMGDHLVESARSLEAELAPEYVADSDAFFAQVIAFKKTVADPTMAIAVDLEALWPRLHRAHRQAVDALLAKAHLNSVVVSFKFPEEIQVACEQYLLYFVQFLRDIGIEATANLTEEAGNVLFAVTPKNKEEALDNIRAALGVYLRLPSHPQLGLATPATDIEVQRLVANIHHLNGQLALASAAIQLRDNLIQQAVVNRPVLVEAIQQEQEGAPDKEPIVGDIVSIKKFEWQFLEVDLPTLIRRLKERFRRNPPE